MALEQHRVTRAELERMFEQHRIWERIAGGELTTEIISSTPARLAPGGKSLMRKHFDKGRRHVPTSHVVLDKEGKEIHRDTHDLTLGDQKFIALD